MGAAIVKFSPGLDLKFLFRSSLRQRVVRRVRFPKYWNLNGRCASMRALLNAGGAR
jgi:hypothetical protein